MKTIITYGTFDLFHQGHYNLLRRAKELGDFLIVGVTTDNFDLQRGKMNTVQDVMTRVDNIRATNLADKIIIEEYPGQKIDDIQKYKVDIFAIGSDWFGKFDYLKDYCNVVYLPRTEGISSTQIRNSEMLVNVGIIGSGSMAGRFISESKFVNSIEVSSAYNPNIVESEQFCKEYGIEVVAKSLDDLFFNCNAVYIASPPNTHYEYTKQALLNGKHVLCETPFVFEEKQAIELFKIAKDKSLQLMIALKTAYCPSFLHLISLLRTGVIGEIVEINCSVTTLMDEFSSKLDPKLCGGSMSENACFPMLPILKLFGTKLKKINFYSRIKNDTDIFTKAIISFPSGISSFQVGLGVKSEGSLIVSGTKGYAYVPAPWWKTDYFELRFEDINQNKKYFYPYEGYGLRYEIKEFVSSIILKENNCKISIPENICMAKIQELYRLNRNVYEI